MYEKSIENLEEDLVKVMRCRLRSTSYIDSFEWTKLMKEICEALEKLYILEKITKKGNL